MDQKYAMAFDKFRFIMTYSTILGVTEIISSLRLVLEGKTGKKISESSRLEFLSSFKNPFATIICLSELYFRFKRFILSIHTKKVISMNYGSSTSSSKTMEICEA